MVYAGRTPSTARRRGASGRRRRRRHEQRLLLPGHRVRGGSTSRPRAPSTEAEHVVSSAQAGGHSARAAGRPPPGAGHGLEVRWPTRSVASVRRRWTPRPTTRGPWCRASTGHLGCAEAARRGRVTLARSVLWCATNTDRTIPKERGVARGQRDLGGGRGRGCRSGTARGGGKPAPVQEPPTTVGSTRPAVVGSAGHRHPGGARRSDAEGVEVLAGVDSAATVLAACWRSSPRSSFGSLRELFEPYRITWNTAARVGHVRGRGRGRGG
ncbi:hypothetical protein QJS66_06095 [Kocuria rhizophila]|nr:hypothetical protein QJS66_06095 [Kocuria rhizophila]